MNLPPPPALASRFFDYLLAQNQPQMAGFRRWLIQPGMEFNAPVTWWGNRQARATPHEGLDLCWFEDALGGIRQLDHKIKIPAAWSGQVVRLTQDFLGKSVFLRHEIFAADGRQLYSAYGHTRPRASLQAGQTVAAGEILATLAAAGERARVPLHLHITLAWAPPALAPDRLDWRTLGSDRGLELIDPWPVLSASS